MATRGDQTREHLLDVAEQLFSERGVSNVSLRQIRLAAEQGNAAAVQYYFGDRDGVVAALAERHMTAVQAIQARYVAELERSEEPTVRLLVAVLFRPLADYVAQGPSGRAWVKILAELTSDPQLSLDTIAERSDPNAVKIGTRLIELLSPRMSPELAGERLWATSQFVIHVCADRATIHDDPKSTRKLSSDETFAENLIDMSVGALTADVHVPPSDAG